ncbi:CG13605 [Drosophila busckii]|uniref:CG13605 n=1 Tax=Drosophila busckii TaxID=30019 RepID=A0A0M3QYC4_DROBS|nr:E3 ubiquitin-protein ligase RNFT1 [Drosophila busckii]ALC47433.1 CG13605 [Drosophila busckii]
MSNGPNDVSSDGRGRGAGQAGSGIASAVSINIESDADDNESTTAENDCLLPTPMVPLSTLTYAQQMAGTTAINMELAHTNPGRSSSLSGTGPRHSSSNMLSSFLARQRSFTPTTGTNNNTPVRASTQMNRRLQQSRSVSANNSNVEETPAAQPDAVRRLDFWRVNLNEMFSLSTAPSPEALRTFIAHSNFRYQPAARSAAAAAVASPALAEDQNQMAPTEPEASTSTAGSIRTNNSGAMARSISLREGDMQQPRNSLAGRHTASVIGLTTPSSPGILATVSPTLNETADGGGGAGNETPPDPADNANGNGAHENNVDDDHIVTDIVVQVLSHFVRYLPIICILLIKFVHDHLQGIIDLLLLQTIMYNMNRSLRLQVARLAQKDYTVLVRDGCILIVVVTLRLFLASTPPDPLGLLVPPPKKYIIVNVSSHSNLEETLFHTSGDTMLRDVSTETAVPKVIPLGVLLYYVAVSDLLLKLLTILVKIFITLLPIHVIRLKVRARLYVLVEYTSHFYRALCPISQWFIFLYESYSGLEIISGGLFASLYIGAKIFELLERGKMLKKAITTFRRNIDSERPPTKEELDAAGSVCPICHDSYNSPIILECGHIFCDECVQTWFKREQTCPMCRAKVSDDPAWQDGGTTFFHQLY